MKYVMYKFENIISNKTNLYNECMLIKTLQKIQKNPKTTTTTTKPSWDAIMYTCNPSM